MFWWRIAGSNRWPPECKSGALPAELIPHDLKLVGRERLELSTPPLSRVCSNQLSYRPLCKEKHYFKKRNEDGQHYLYYYLEWNFTFIHLRKEVIQPQVPLRLPCYDFTPVADYTVVKGFKPCLKVEPTPMVWRAVCTRPGNAFTVARWSTITSNSSFMHSSCRVQSELRYLLGICLTSQSCFLL